ncbi:MAG: protoheme IX farnesyltransferase [Chloroflexi bacterium]|jgi:protoheme IX farnesyltransferase|nr:protoheme IX farnesyltransferase [Chloroflexota bacterium]
MRFARQIITLSKPRVIFLLVVTGAAGVWKASEGDPDIAILLAVIFGGTLASAGSNAINQAFDSDIDALMRRTRHRPVPSNDIGAFYASAVGMFFIILSILIMFQWTNLLASILMMVAAAVYVFVYTIVLKRRSWNNIVIGGAAGAFPPLIGATAVSGEITAIGLYMFGFIFFWTPPHFWTLSILLKDDYADAKIPMLSVVASLRDTTVQIALYVMLLIVFSWLPVVAGYAGLTFAFSSSILGVFWLQKIRLMFKEPSSKNTLSTYKFSLLHLALVFLVLALEPHLPWY